MPLVHELGAIQMCVWCNDKSSKWTEEEILGSSPAFVKISDFFV